MGRVGASDDPSEDAFISVGEDGDGGGAIEREADQNETSCEREGPCNDTASKLGEIASIIVAAVKLHHAIGLSVFAGDGELLGAEESVDDSSCDIADDFES